MSKKDRILIGKAFNSTLNVYRYPNKKKPANKIKPVSTKRAKQNREYSELRSQQLQQHPFCKAQIKGVCTVQATDIHHMKGRGKYLLEVNTWLCVCRQCHNWIELNPKQAKELGFSLNRLS